MKLPQLTLRELFLLVALAAMSCGWWIDRGRLATRVGELERFILDGLRGTEAMQMDTAAKQLEMFKETGSFGPD